MNKKTAGNNSSNSDDDPLIFENENGTSTRVGFTFVHTDHLGSVVMFTDGYGQPLTGGQYGGSSEMRYLPYGQTDSSNSKGPVVSSFGYTGQRKDTNTGLLYYKFRYYDANLGRFISADDRISPDKMGGMNKLSYADNNPINYNDPDGHNAWIHMFNQIVKHTFWMKGGSGGKSSGGGLGVGKLEVGYGPGMEGIA